MEDHRYVKLSDVLQKALQTQYYFAVLSMVSKIPQEEKEDGIVSVNILFRLSRGTDAEDVIKQILSEVPIQEHRTKNTVTHHIPEEDDEEEVECDCSFCCNATTCEELTPENDLSYKSLPVVVADGYTAYFQTGAGRKTSLTLEKDGHAIMYYAPKFCPNCGRELRENNLLNKNKSVLK